MYQRVAVVGCGLMGASLVEAIKHRFPEITLYGVDPRGAALRVSTTGPCLKAVYESVTDLPKHCDLVVVCTPIDQVVPTIQMLADHMYDATVLTDIASTKSAIEAAVTQLNISQCFIPGHPMCGKETSGFESASATLYQGAPFFIVPKQGETYRQYRQFLVELGVVPVEISAAQHDQVVAAVSHLPYVVAAMLVTTVTDDATKISTACLQQTYGPGFQDTSRVAGSSPEWATSVCAQNKAALVPLLRLFIAKCTALVADIEAQSLPELERQFTHIQATHRALKRE